MPLLADPVAHLSALNKKPSQQVWLEPKVSTEGLSRGEARKAPLTPARCMRAEGEVSIINKYMNFNCGDIKHTVGGRSGTRGPLL